MSHQMSSVAHDRRLAQALFDSAQDWRMWSALSQLSTAGLLVAVLFFQVDSVAVVTLIMVASIFSAFAKYRGEAFGQLGNEFLDVIERSLAFGVELPATTVRNLIARVPARIEREAVRKPADEGYFYQLSDPGPRRAMEMYAESAWWSQQLSDRHAGLYLGCALAFFVAAAAVMYAGLVLVEDQAARARLACIVAQLITLAVSLEWCVQSARYRRFRAIAAELSKQADRLSKAEVVSEHEALAVFHQYQRARAEAPPFRAFLWRQDRRRLNALWRAFAPRSKIDTV